jgi:hypothetical protein
MQAINAIFEGNSFRPLEPIPVDGKYEVVITFTKPIEVDNEALKQSLLDIFGMGDDEDVKNIQEIIDDRSNFFRGRPEI